MHRIGIQKAKKDDNMMHMNSKKLKLAETVFNLQ